MKSYIFAISTCGLLLFASCQDNKVTKTEITRENAAQETRTEVADIDLDKVPSADLSCDSTNTANLSVESIEIKDYDKLLTFTWDEGGKAKYAQLLISLAMPTGMPQFDIKGLQKEIINKTFGKDFSNAEQAINSIRKYDGKSGSKLINALPEGVNTNEVQQMNINCTLIDMYYDILCYQIKITKENEETTILNYDLQQGKLLTFDDFFRSDKKSELINEITKHAQEGNYTFDKSKTPENIYFQRNAVNVIYNLSEVSSPDGIAPYITIPLATLKPYMTDFAIARFKL